jgi:hypothetical protein
MAVASEPDNTPLPGTVFNPRQVRLLKIAVIVMGILLVAGFAFVLAAIVYQASRLGDGAAPVGATVSQPMALPEGLAAELPIPQGAEVTTLSLDGDRLAVHLKSQAGAEIAVIDLRSGKVLARVRLKPAQ